MFKIVLLFFIILITGCSDKEIVTIYNKNILNEKISCLELIVFPPNKMISSTLEKKYKFQDSCDLKLEVFTKGKIHCNSNQNSQLKALGEIPSAYLRMEITKNDKTLYSYYIDIRDEVKNTHIEAGFFRMKKDLLI